MSTPLFACFFHCLIFSYRCKFLKSSEKNFENTLLTVERELTGGADTDGLGMAKTVCSLTDGGGTEADNEEGAADSPKMD